MVGGNWLVVGGSVWYVKVDLDGSVEDGLFGRWFDVVEE